MAIALLLALMQQPAAPAPASPIARVEVTPARAEIQIGQTVRLSGRALDANGNPVPGARIAWFAGGGEGSVDSTGLVLGGYRGAVQVRAVGSMAGKSGSAFGESVVTVLPAPRRVEVRPAVARLAAGTRLTLAGVAYSAQNDRRDDPVRFSSSAPRVVSVSADGRLSALAPGRATITARAGAASAPMAVEVIANPVTRLTLEPAGQSVRTGDVVRFQARPTDASGRAVRNVAVRWSMAAMSPAGVAQVDDEGAFVAEAPGRYTVSATIGAQTTDAVVDVVPRRVGRGIEVEGRVPIALSEAPKCGCTRTGSAPICPRLRTGCTPSTCRSPGAEDRRLDDDQCPHRERRDDDGRRQATASSRARVPRTGRTASWCSMPATPAIPSRSPSTRRPSPAGCTRASCTRATFTSPTTRPARCGSSISGTRAHPKEVGRWQTEQTEAGRYLHDIMVVDGLAYLAYWNDGLVILDVGNGMKGGIAEKPVLVSQFKYDLSCALRPGGRDLGTLARAAPIPRGGTATTCSSATRSTPAKARRGCRTATTSPSAGST